MKVFEKAQWIWINSKEEKDVYADFMSYFDTDIKFVKGIEIKSSFYSAEIIK